MGYTLELPLVRPLYNVNLNINVLISTPEEKPSLLKGHFSGAKGWPHKRGCTVQCIEIMLIFIFLQVHGKKGLVPASFIEEVAISKTRSIKVSKMLPVNRDRDGMA